MKAVIVDIKDNNAAILSENGRISQVKNKNYVIGQRISMKDNNYIKWALLVAAVMILALLAWAYMTPYSYVSLDVNPSFEFSINIFDRVLEVEAVNGDAEEILEEMNIDGLKNKEIQEAVKNVLHELKNQEYFVEGEEGGVIVATSSKSQEKISDLAETLRIAVNKELEEDGEFSINMEVIGVSQEKVIEAKEYGVTPGKMNLVENLKESLENPDNFKMEEWLDKPVEDIMKAIKENKEAGQNEIEINLNGNGNKDSVTENGNKNNGNTNSSSGNGKN